MRVGVGVALVVVVATRVLAAFALRRRRLPLPPPRAGRAAWCSAPSESRGPGRPREPRPECDRRPHVLGQATHRATHRLIESKSSCLPTAAPPGRLDMGGSCEVPGVCRRRRVFVCGRPRAPQTISVWRSPSLEFYRRFRAEFLGREWWARGWRIVCAGCVGVAAAGGMVSARPKQQAGHAPRRQRRRLRDRRGRTARELFRPGPRSSGTMRVGPVKKMLTSQRAMLSALDEFRDALTHTHTHTHAPPVWPSSCPCSPRCPARAARSPHGSAPASSRRCTPKPPTGSGGSRRTCFVEREPRWQSVRAASNPPPSDPAGARTARRRSATTVVRVVVLSK